MTVANSKPPYWTISTAAPLFCDQIAQILDSNRKKLFLILALLYLAAFNGQWQMEPDAALYLTLGRNIAWGRGYTYLGQPHTLAYPGLPYALAGIFRIFPQNPDDPIGSARPALAAADAMILACGFAVLWLTYRLFKIAYDRPTAVVITLGVGVSAELFRYCFEIMTEIPFLMAVMAFLAGHEALFGPNRTSLTAREKPWLNWLLLLGGIILAMTLRPTMLGLLAAWLVSMFWTAVRVPRLRKGIAIALAAFVVAGILFLKLDPRNSLTSASSSSYEHVAISRITQLSFFKANLLGLLNNDIARSTFGHQLGNSGFEWINWIPGVFFIVAGLALIRERLIWGLWIAATLFMEILLVHHDRYLIEVLPLFVLTWWKAAKWANAVLPRRAGNLVFGIMMFMGTGPNSFLCAATSVHQQERPFLSYYRNGKMAAYVQMAVELRKWTAQSDVIVAPPPYGRILTFLSNRNVYEPVGPEAVNGNVRQFWLILGETDLPDYGDVLSEAQWMSARHVETVGDAAVAEVPRIEIGQMPLKLWRAEIESGNR